MEFMSRLENEVKIYRQDYREDTDLTFTLADDIEKALATIATLTRRIEAADARWQDEHEQVIILTEKLRWEVSETARLKQALAAYRASEEV
jgi:hypothetical protein